MTYTLDEPLTIEVVEKKSPVLTLTMTMGIQGLRALGENYQALTERYTKNRNFSNKHKDTFLIPNLTMNRVKNFTSTNYARENSLWEKSTNCSKNFTVTRYKVIRNLRFKPLELAVGYLNLRYPYDMETTELPIIRANYFCYTYSELLYILYVCLVGTRA